MKRVQIIGAGFSGLTLAHHLQNLGLNAEIFEAGSSVGGLLGTLKTDSGLVETAANAVLADKAIEELFDQLGVSFAEQLPKRKKRFVFWDQPRRWPLSSLTTAKMLWVLGQARLGAQAVFPYEEESVHAWAGRVVNAEFEEKLLAPALQGIFAGDSRLLSARLTLGSILKERPEVGRRRGSVAPVGGMGELIDRLEASVRRRGGLIHLGTPYVLERLPDDPVVVCTNAWAAADVLNSVAPVLAEQLRRAESLPLISATCFFDSHPNDLQGFGCLFPPSQGFAASGVVFNTCVFNNRSPRRSETWILGGAHRLGLIRLSDDEILAQIEKDRRRLMPAVNTPVRDAKITRWPRAIPHYTLAWERVLSTLSVPRPMHLHGNYLGGIGLSRIHQRSIRLARELKENYGA